MRTPILYVTRDIERATGLASLPAGYYIVANMSPYAEIVQAKFRDQVLLVRSENVSTSSSSNASGSQLDTIDLLAHPATEAFVKNITKACGKKPGIVVFKNTARIERLAREKGWKLLNPSASLAERLENKITQISSLGTAARFLIPGTRLAVCMDLAWEGVPFVLQFAHTHTGEGTILVKSVDQLTEIQKQFPQREVRVSPFVKGSMYTSNNCVVPMRRVLRNGFGLFGAFSRPKTLVGNISYQITGLAPFTDLPFSTVGNDWKKGAALSAELRKQYEEMARACGARLAVLGWKGLFGIDAILDESSQCFYLIEINARQPASTTFESALQCPTRATEKALTPNTAQTNTSLLTTFEAHLEALTAEISSDAQLQRITEGGQIIQRLTALVANELKNSPGVMFDKAEALRTEGYTVIEYANTKPNSDLLRIQSKKGIIDSPLCNPPQNN
ncbi:MAG: hypothetical protein WCO79_02620 [bacterium]